MPKTCNWFMPCCNRDDVGQNKGVQFSRIFHFLTHNFHGFFIAGQVISY